MNKVKLSQGKLSLINVLSLGSMILGIGCICWVAFSMLAQAQSDYSPGVPPSTFATGLNELKGDSTATTELGDSSAPLHPDKTLYPIYSEGDNIGSLSIPALKRKLPIIQGTGVKALNEGVGHFTQSVLPGEEDNCVLSGHRDTVFRQLGNLKIGDQLIVQTSTGIFTYEMDSSRIVHKDDRTVIVPTDNAILTLTTCYPFYFLGDAPDRYIISAVLVKSEIVLTLKR